MRICKNCKELEGSVHFSKKDFLCKPCRSIVNKRDYQKNAVKIKNLRKKDYEENHDKHIARNNTYRAKNKDTIEYKVRRYLGVKSWRSRHKGEVTAFITKYRAKKLNATPSWLTLEHRQEIIEIYILASNLSGLTANGLHVDHIVPLQGKNVCGLHVPWNLQILDAIENSRKGNR